MRQGRTRAREDVGREAFFCLRKNGEKNGNALCYARFGAERMVCAADEA